MKDCEAEGVPEGVFEAELDELEPASESLSLSLSFSSKDPRRGSNEMFSRARDIFLAGRELLNMLVNRSATVSSSMVAEEEAVEAVE